MREEDRTWTGSLLGRRQFLARAGLALGGTALVGSLPACNPDQEGAQPKPNLREDWDAVRDQFALTRDRIHMAGFLLASHPRPVRDAIEMHRRGLDENPADYLHRNGDKLEVGVRVAAAEYMGGSPDDIALTDSTTMGLGLLYGGLQLHEGQEILTTIHDHYAAASSLRLRAERTGATIRWVDFYRDLSTVSKDEIVENLTSAVRPQTRIVAVTWVHSSTGLKLPIRELADALAEINGDRNEEERALLCVDGVHGFGVEDASVEDLGCDFFVAGCHKWLFGPRGTGVVWGKPEAWPIAGPIIPTFDGRAYGEWITAHSYAHWWDAADKDGGEQLPAAAAMTPGGYHSFEHRWALDEAFRFHREIGRSRVAERVHELNRRLKEGMVGMPRVRLHTPVDEELSSGIASFEVEGLSTGEVVGRLGERGVIASGAPYHPSYARIAPSLLTSSEDVDETLREVRRFAG